MQLETSKNDTSHIIQRMKLTSLFLCIICINLASCKEETTNIFPSETSQISQPQDRSILTPEFRGDMDSGGGDQYAQEFTEVAYELIRTIKKEPILGVNYSDLLFAVENTRVVSQDNLILNEKEVDFIKHPKLKLIEINRYRWDQISDRYRKLSMVLHEYLGIMGIKDERYQVTGQLDRSNVCESSPLFRETLEKTLGKSCWRMVKDDLRHLNELDFYGLGFENNEIIASDFKNLRAHEIDFHQVTFSQKSNLSFSFVNPLLKNKIFVQNPRGKITKNTFYNVMYTNELELQFDPYNDINTIDETLEDEFLEKMTDLKKVTFYYYSQDNSQMNFSDTEIPNVNKLINKMNNMPSSIKQITLFYGMRCESKRLKQENNPNHYIHPVFPEHELVFDFLREQGFLCEEGSIFIRD